MRPAVQEAALFSRAARRTQNPRCFQAFALQKAAEHGTATRACNIAIPGCAAIPFVDELRRTSHNLTRSAAHTSAATGVSIQPTVQHRC